MNTRVLTVLVLTSCGYHVGRWLPDGGVEYKFPDGGWTAPGDGCGCQNVQDQLVDLDNGNVLLECLPADFCSRPLDGGSCQTTVCFGPKCCVWTLPQGPVKL